MSNSLDVTYNREENKSVKYIPHKLLVGGGPPNISPRVLFALSQPALSPLCPEIYKMMDEIQEMLKYVFQTTNKVTFGIQSPGTGGLESVFSSLLEPGEKIIVAVSGFWGKRIVEIARRRQLDVVEIWSEIGDAFTLEALEKEIIKHKPVLLFIVQGESSVGVLQPLEDLGEICHKHNCLLGVDAVASLGSTPLFVDRWKIDVAVSSSNKAMRGPAGIAYLTFSPNAVERLINCKTKPPLYYDLKSLASLWNCFNERTPYHYTFSAHFLFAAKEGLAEIIEQGLENAWKQHKSNSDRLHSGMNKLGCESFVKNPKISLPMINVFRLPPTINLNKLMEYVSKNYHVEFGVGIGLGYSAEVSQCLRIGIMGYNSRIEVVEFVLKVLEDTFKYFETQQI